MISEELANLAKSIYENKYSNINSMPSWENLDSAVKCTFIVNARLPFQERQRLGYLTADEVNDA